MEVAELVRRTRTYRRFKQDAIPMETLRALVDIARLCPSGGNVQPLKFILSCDQETNSRIFPATHWAGYLVDWRGPSEHERPTAYIVIVTDTRLSKSGGVGSGICAQAIVMGAMEQGIGAFAKRTEPLWK